MGFVHLRADPEAGADTGTRGTRHGAETGRDAEVPGLERFHHLGVPGIAAGRDHRALLRDVADVLPVAVLRDAAGHPAVLLLKLHHRGVVVEAGALLHGVVVEDVVQRHLAHLLGRVADREVLVARLNRVTDFIHQLDADGFETVAEPVDRFAGIVSPEADELLLHVAAGVAGRHRDEVELVDLRSFRLLIAGVDRAEVLTDTGAGGEAVDTDDLSAVFRGGGHREHAARAAADHEDVGRDGRGNILLGDFRGLPEPVTRVVFRRVILRDHFNRDLALRLGDALRGSLLHGAGRD